MFGFCAIWFNSTADFHVDLSIVFELSIDLLYRKVQNMTAIFPAPVHEPSLERAKLYSPTYLYTEK